MQSAQAIKVKYTIVTTIVGYIRYLIKERIRGKYHKMVRKMKDTNKCSKRKVSEQKFKMECIET